MPANKLRVCVLASKLDTCVPTMSPISPMSSICFTSGIGGWSDLHVVTRGTQIAVRITHIFSDPIEELSALCCGLLQGEPRNMVRLHDEPGATVVIASIYARQKHVAHIEFWTARAGMTSPHAENRH
jgi:hypothetical protein